MPNGIAHSIKPVQTDFVSNTLSLIASQLTGVYALPNDSLATNERPNMFVCWCMP
jgi:hypothetical protein